MQSKYFVLFLFAATFSLSCNDQNGHQDINKVTNKVAFSSGVNELEINIDALPKEIINDISQRFMSAKILEIDEVTDPDGRVYFDIEIQIGSEFHEVMYELSGEFNGYEDEDEYENEEDEDHDMGRITPIKE